MLATITQKKPLLTPRTQLTRTKNSSAETPEGPTKNATYNFTSADKRQLMKDLNSPSASQRVRALKALKTPSKGRYSMFDVPDEVHVTEEERLAATKPKTIQEVMKHVVAYVEVRSDGDDRSEGIMKVLTVLGAQVNRTLVRNTTHVIFRGGRLSTYKKAKSWNIPMVSVLWIEACKTHLGLVDPKDYPVSNLEKYERPELYKPVRCPKSLLAPVDLYETPKNAAALCKPIRFNTPVADSLRREMQEISKKLKEAEIPLPAASPIKLVHTEPANAPKTEPRVTYRPNAQEMAKALMNLKNLKTSPAAVKSTIDLTDSPEKVKLPSSNRRRTLFTPNPVYEESAPVTVVKAENRRRTLFTPNPIVMETVPKMVENRRRTLFTPNPNDTEPKFETKTDTRRRTLFPSCKPTKAVEKLQNQNEVKTTPHRRRTLYKPQPDTPMPKTVIRKRKLETEVLKENTPPKRAPLLLTKKVANSSLVDQPILAKRRRTMLTIPSKFL